MSGDDTAGSGTAGSGQSGASAPPAALLDVQDVTLAFKAVKAVSGVSFAVRRHEICALIGPNGAGKSSLLNIISGVYRPDSGSLCFEGERVAAMLPRRAAERGIARTFQNIAIFKSMSVLENVLTGANLRFESSWLEQLIKLGRAPGDETRERERAERVIEFLGIQRYRHAPVGQLSYGLQKRVELGRALAASPKLLLLDEPIAGMNAEEKREMSDFILDVNRELGATVVLILLSLAAHKTRLGLALRSVADDPLAALSLGVRLPTIWRSVWSLAGLVGLIAGLFWGSRSGVQFSLTLVVLKAMPLLIIGGFDSIGGAIVGGLIVGAGEKLAEVYLGQLIGAGLEENGRIASGGSAAETLERDDVQSFYLGGGSNTALAGRLRPRRPEFALEC